MRVGIIGAGSFGRALYLQIKKRHDAILWKRGDDIKKAVTGRDMLIFAVPAQAFRQVFTDAALALKDQELPIIVNAAKGLEVGTNMRLSQVAGEIMPNSSYVCLSGPSHAEEVAEFMPTAVVASSEDSIAAARVQEAMMTASFRVYTNSDLIGAELGGALKNVIALGAGISDGRNLGDNCKAAIMTRGMAEITRLGVAMGAQRETFSGLTGMGDLMVTCTSQHSRNRRCGILIGQGVPTAEAVRQVGMVVEGITTVEAAYDISEEYGVEMPITRCIYMLTHNMITVDKAVELLMCRSKKKE